MRSLFALLIALALTACAGGSAEKDGTVVIAAGSSLTSAARALEQEGAIDSSTAFLRYAKVFGSSDPIKPGEYKIKAGMSSSEILELLQSGKTFQRFVIVPPGMPSILVHERLLATALLTGDVAVPAEGSILPDSYAYTRGEKRSAVVARMQLAMKKTLADLWAARKPPCAAGSPAPGSALWGLLVSMGLLALRPRVRR